MEHGSQGQHAELPGDTGLNEGVLLGELTALDCAVTWNDEMGRRSLTCDRHFGGVVWSFKSISAARQ